MFSNRRVISVCMHRTSRSSAAFSSPMFVSCSSSANALADVRVPNPTRPSGDAMALSSNQSVSFVRWTDESGMASTLLLALCFCWYFLVSLLTRPGPLRSSDLAHLRGVVLPAHPQFIGYRRQAGTEPDDRAPGAKPTGT